MQSKFLNLVEDNTPDDSVDRNTKAKLTVLRALVASSEEVKIKNKQFTNVFFFTDIEGNEYKVSIDNVGVENNEVEVDVAQIANNDNEEVKKAKAELSNKLVQSMRKLTDQIK